MLYTYEYDELGQLIEECSRPEQKCITYIYDLNGNITTKIEYPVEISLKDHIFKVETPTRTYTYSYNNDLWKDELTSYTRVIHDSSGDRTYTTPANTYDAIGNPTKYFGSDLEWDYGRQLRRFYSGIYDTTYSYNADGMLIKQAVTYNTIPDYPINYSYENFYDGTMLIRRTGQGFDAWFDYDESGSPVGMNVTTTTGSSSNPTVTTAQYYFIKNLQGDIVAMADSTGAIKCSYTYNSWGKVLSVVGPNGTPSLTDYTNPANINPFRYRGYYYDAENQLYWLQSRFYDPSTGRFINADGYVSTGQGLLGTNMFLYCNNNPVIFADYTGGMLVICDYGGDGPAQRKMAVGYLEPHHGPYEKIGPYATADEAARAFGEAYYASSLYIRHEYGSAIYATEHNGVTTYGYALPVKGGPHEVCCDDAIIPWNATRIATIHTHPNSIYFSGRNGKYGDITLADKIEIDSYLIGPNLVLQKYDPRTKQITAHGSISLAPLTAAEKSALVNQFKSSWYSHLATQDDKGFECHRKIWPTP